MKDLFYMLKCELKCKMYELRYETEAKDVAKFVAKKAVDVATPNTPIKKAVKATKFIAKTGKRLRGK